MAMILTKEGKEMKMFSIVCRNKLTDKLFSGVVDHAELCRISNLEGIRVCCVREIEEDAPLIISKIFEKVKTAT